MVSPFMSPDGVVKHQIYMIFVRFMAMPDPDKCELLEIEFDPIKKKYVDTPTLSLFAKKFGVHRNTLRDWKQRDEFTKNVAEARKEWGKDRTGNVLASLYRRCIQHGNAYDVELWLAYFENWDRKQVVKVITDKFAADDLRTIIAALPQEQQDEWYVKIGELITLAERNGSGREIPQNSASESGSDS